MSRCHPYVASAFVAALVATGVPRFSSAQDATWALTNARIETVGNGTIEKGTIVIRDGLIAAVGASVTIPPDARVLDLSGRTVYPGIIDLTSSIGLRSGSEDSRDGARGGFGGGPEAAPGTPVGLEPQRNIADELRPSPAEINAARNAGITAVLTAPARGAFRGQAALIPMRDSSLRTSVIRAPVALTMGFQGISGDYPRTLLGVIAYERQAMYDAQHQALLLDRYRANPRGMERPEYRPDIDALIPVVRGELPVFFEANEENEIRRALRMEKEFDLDMTIVGATEGFLTLDALKGQGPVVVSVDFPRPQSVTGWSYRYAVRHSPDDSARADSLARIRVESNPAALVAAGIPIALASGSLSPADFLTSVRTAVKRGLPHDAAIAALTQRPAEIAGAGRMLGTVERGKIANLVVTRGDLLSDSGVVTMVFVDGIRSDVEAPRTARTRRGRAGAGPAAATAMQVTGNWNLTVNTAQGASTATMTITQDGTNFRGQMMSELGTVNISDGQIAGRTMHWSVTAPIGGEDVVITFDGTLEGDDGRRMSGTANLGAFGSASFTATRNP